MTVLLVAVPLAGCGGGGSDTKKSGDLLSAGLAAHVRGDLAAAKKDYQAVIDKDPGNKYAYYNLGLIAQQSNQDDLATSYYRKVLAIDADYPPALFNLAIVRTKVAPQEAIDLYRHVIAVKPDDPAAHLNLGFLLKSLDRNDEGNTELAKAAMLDPSIAGRIGTPDLNQPAVSVPQQP